MLRVFFGDEGIADRPLDADRGIVPQDAAFILRAVEIAALVEELNSFGQRQVSVCKSGRNEQLILLFRGKIHARPLSEVGSKRSAAAAAAGRRERTAEEDRGAAGVGH